MNDKKKIRVIMPTSSGGHLSEVLQLKKIMANYDYLVVTEDLPWNKKILEGKNGAFVRPNGQNRDLTFWKNFMMNWFSAFKIMRKFKPHLLITTGSHTAVPFCFLAKIMGCKVIYILTFCRTDSRAKAADLVYPIADVFFVQWEQMKEIYKKGIYAGKIF